MIEASKNADLLIHDSTLSEETKEYALDYMHSTAVEAAEVAKEAGVRRLILTHLSARYSDLDGARKLKEEAQQIFENTDVASDLMTIEVGYRDE